MDGSNCCDCGDACTALVAARVLVKTENGQGKRWEYRDMCPQCLLDCCKGDQEFKPPKKVTLKDGGSVAVGE